MVDAMSDISRQQKVASAKKKLKKFQKTKSPVNRLPLQDDILGREILKGIQNNHIFKTPPLTVSNKQTSPEKVSRPTSIGVNQKLSFSPIASSPENTSPSPTSFPVSPAIVAASTLANTVPSVIGGPEHIIHTSGIAVSNKDKDDLEQMVSCYKRTNEQLGNQVQEQRKQIIQLQERLKKEGQVTAQLTEQRALKEQLEVHIQTIGILVSEKSELQSSIANLQKKLNYKETELTEINKQLQKSHQQVVDLEKNNKSFQANNEQLKQTNKDLKLERERFSNKLYEVSRDKDDIVLQNSELHAKLQVKVEECSLLLNQVNDLHAKLQKGELIVQQLSTASVDPQAIKIWQAEKEELVKLIDEQKSIVQKLVTDKAELLQKHNDTERHYDMQIEQLKNKINSLEDERKTLFDKTIVISNNLLEVQSQLEAASFKNSKHDSSTPSSEDSKYKMTQKEYDSFIQAKLNLEKELDIQINENRRLGRIIFDQNSKIEELEAKMQRLNTDSTDRASLLNQIQADKETISRALQQNKLLKEQLEELEQGFVKMSNNSADLTSRLESEQHGNKDVATKLSDLQVELEETKMKLVNKSSTCENLAVELQMFKEELHDVQMRLASKEMDLDLLNTELQTVKHELSKTERKPVSVNRDLVLTERLQEELHSAQETINQLSNHNLHLKETINELQSSSIPDKQGDGSLYPGHQISSSQSSKYYSSGHNDDDTDDEVDALTAEEEHARSWQELEYHAAREATEETSSDSDYFEEHEALRITNEQVEQMHKSLQQLQKERAKILQLLQIEREKAFQATERVEEHVALQVQQQLKQHERELQEHFYEQTEALHSKVQSLQEALEIMRKNEDIADFDMTSDGITMPLLKTAFMQLQKRYKSAMDAKAQLSDRIEHLEHINRKLETETETIGEYIALYQTQRQALKAKFNEKDHIIIQLSNEHGRMQTKVSQLHQLVIQMLSERSGIESKNKQLQELVNRRLAFQTGHSSKEEEVPKLQYNLDNLFGQMTLTPEEENELIKDNITVDESIRRDSTINNDQTTQQILQLFEQLETTGEGYRHGWLSPAARRHDFKPCKNCIGDPIYL